MTRYDNTIYHRKPIDINDRDTTCPKITRPDKLSAIRKELRSKISMCQMRLKHAGPYESTEFLDKTRKDLGKYQRQLENLPDEKPHKIKRTYKKLSQEKIREYVLDQIEKSKIKEELYITADDIAHQLNVKTHFVKQVFQQLNVEGVLSQPIHHAPHDSNRDPWGFPNCKGWMADLYRINYPDEKEEEEE
jgi:ribosomal protein S25